MNRKTLAIAAAMTCTTAAVVALGATITADIAQGDNLVWDVENPDFSFTVAGGSGTITAHTNVYETIGFLPVAVSGGQVHARRLRDMSLAGGPSFDLRLAADCDGAGHNCELIGTDTTRQTWSVNQAIKVTNFNHHVTIGGGETASITIGDRLNLADAHVGFHADSVLGTCSVANGRTQFRGTQVFGGDATATRSNGESCVNVIDGGESDADGVENNGNETELNAATESCYGDEGEEYLFAFEAAAEGFSDPSTGYHMFLVESLSIGGSTLAGVRKGRNWTLVSVTANAASNTARARTTVHEWGHVMGLGHTTGASCSGATSANNFMCSPSGQQMTPAQCTTTFGNTTFPDLRP